MSASGDRLQSSTAVFRLLLMNSCCIQTLASAAGPEWKALKTLACFFTCAHWRWRCLSPLFSWVLSAFVSVSMLSSSLPAHPTLAHLFTPSPFVFLFLSLPCSLSFFLSLYLVELNANTEARTDESSTCLLMNVWFVYCRLRKETGSSRRSWNWLSRSCSRPSAWRRPCLRWRPS